MKVCGPCFYYLTIKSVKIFFASKEELGIQSVKESMLYSVHHYINWSVRLFIRMYVCMFAGLSVCQPVSHLFDEVVPYCANK